MSVASVVVGLLVSTAAVAQEGAAIKVAQDGSADHGTITEAVEAASDGDTIVIAPGAYVENLYIEKVLTLVGDGPREEIVVLQDESDRQIVDISGLMDASVDRLHGLAIGQEGAATPDGRAEGRSRP